MKVTVRGGPPWGEERVTADAAGVAIELEFDALDRSVSLYPEDDGWTFSKDGAEGEALAAGKPLPSGQWMSLVVPGWSSDGPRTFVQAPAVGAVLHVVSSRVAK